MRDPVRAGDRPANATAEKLSSIVRSVSQNHEAKDRTARSAQNTPVPWHAPNDGTQRPTSQGSIHRDPQRDSRDSHAQAMREREHRDPQRERVEKYGTGAPRRQHSRDGSGDTGMTAEYGQQPHMRRHDYDVQSMETAISSPRASMTKNPIPAPSVTVRSEFPTLSRSRQQQSLTCLVTVEVPEGRWRPDPADLRGAPVMPPVQEEQQAYARQRPLSPSRVANEWPFESPQVLDEITEDLRIRVDNWHGLDFSRFGRLRLYGTVRVGKDRQSWQELECFLFAEMLICVKEKKGAPPQYAGGDSKRKLTRCTLKGSILIRKHLKNVDANLGMSGLTDSDHLLTHLPQTS